MKDQTLINQVVQNSKQPLQEALVRFYRDLKHRQRQFINFDEMNIPLLKDFYINTIKDAFSQINVNNANSSV